MTDKDRVFVMIDEIISDVFWTFKTYFIVV